MPNQLKVLMVASEATPFAKTGGLADVIGALSPSLRAEGVEAGVLMPRYRGIDIQGLPCVYKDMQVWLGTTSLTLSVYQATVRDVPYFLLDAPALYDRDGLYGNHAGDFPDNAVRFGALAHAALTFVRHVFRPSVIHCHDWQAALVPIYLKSVFGGDPTFMGIPTILTIHNLGYQGLFPPEVLPQIGLEQRLFSPDHLEFYGKVNLLKGGILCADAVTTVSPGYAREIQGKELGFGLDGVLSLRHDAVTGILNGVDYTQWDPATDPHIASHYTGDNLAGKRACKADLLSAFGLPAEPERPLVAMVTRLVSQKGFDLIEKIADELGDEDLSFIVLGGSGDPKYQAMLERMQHEHPDKVAVKIAYDEALAHKIEAGADIFLMPSLYEPCGLNQIYSLRYGTVPVVRATGGLDDTIDAGTGFKFREYDPAVLLATLRGALEAWKDRSAWTRLMRAGMAKDYSWTASAKQYTDLYRRLSA